MDPRINYKKIFSDLKNSIHSLIGDQTRRIILFGSRARGDFNGDSDIDIAIIIPNLTKQIKNKILEEVAKIEFTYFVPLSTHIFSEEQFQNLKKKERRIVFDIENEGIPL